VERYPASANDRVGFKNRDRDPLGLRRLYPKRHIGFARASLIYRISDWPISTKSGSFAAKRKPGALIQVNMMMNDWDG
jgi:hypothetical protein